MQPGELNQYFELSKIEYDIDAKGQQHQRFTPVHKGYAKVTNLSGREYWDAYSVLSENVVRFTTRWIYPFEKVDTRTHFILWREKVYDILAIDNVAWENKTAIFKCKESDIEYMEADDANDQD